MKETSLSGVAENRLFDHPDTLLVAIGDDALNLAIYLQEDVAILRRQTIMSGAMAVLLTAFAARFFSGGVQLGTISS